MAAVITLILITLGLCVNGEIRWRIIGGDDAETGEFPFHVSLRINGKHDCSGSIIHPKVILTAAHCVYAKVPADVVVVTGSNRLDQGGQVYDVVRIKHHESFNPSTIRHDVALLRLARAIVFDKFTKPIRLETKHVGKNIECSLSGFGLDGFPKGNVSNELQYAKLSTISYELCKNMLKPSPVFPTQVCTLSEKGLGTCKGDSGAPLVSNGKQIGVVSWGRKCALGFPDVFTRISLYLNWILFNI